MGRPLRSPEGGFLFRRTRTLLAAAALAALAAGCGASVVPQIMNDSARVPLARKLLDKHDYTLAADVLEGYARVGAGNADIDQVVYLLGVVRLRQHDWVAAQTQFERILRDYPESDSASAASYRLGEAYFGQSRAFDFDQEFTLKALAQWDGFIKSSPDHPFAPDAQVKIAKCRERLAHKLWRTGDVYVKQQLYAPARFYFTSIVQDYSDTPIYGDALIGKAITDARLGQKDSALVVLRGLEKDFKGKPLGIAANKWRLRVEKWPAAGYQGHQHNKPVEPAAPPPQLPSSPSSSGGISGTP